MRRVTLLLLADLVVAACGSSSMEVTRDSGSAVDVAAGGDTAGSTPGHDAAGRSDASVANTGCDALWTQYEDAVTQALECTVGAAGACAMKVQLVSACRCTVFADRDTERLAALAAQLAAASCVRVCNGICNNVTAFECRPDPSSPTGGRCGPKLP